MRYCHFGVSPVNYSDSDLVACHIMVELSKLDFPRPLTSETMLTVSKNAFKGYVLVDNVTY